MTGKIVKADVSVAKNYLYMIELQDIIYQSDFDRLLAESEEP